MSTRVNKVLCESLIYLNSTTKCIIYFVIFCYVCKPIHIHYYANRYIQTDILTRTRHLFNVLQRNSLKVFGIVVFDEETHKILACVQFQGQGLSDLGSDCVHNLPQSLGKLKGALIRSLGIRTRIFIINMHKKTNIFLYFINV